MGTEFWVQKLVFNGYRVLVLQDEKSSGDDGGYSCTTVWKYLISLNCALKMDKMVSLQF